MTVRRLEEDLQKLGLSDGEIRRSLAGMGVLSEGEEADVEEDDSGEGFEDDAYLSDLVDDDDDEEMDEGTRVQRMKKGTAKSRKKSKQYYKANKAKIARTMRQKRKTSGWKRHQKKLARAPKAGGVRVRRMVSDVGLPDSDNISEEILGELSTLAESIDRDPKSRFDEYVEAFNYIADLGELLAMRAMEEDDEEEAARVIQLSILAESVLKEMEDMGGALTPDEDEELEETLDEAMEDVEEVLSDYLIEEDDDDEEDDDEDEDWDDDDEIEEAKKKKKWTKAQTIDQVADRVDDDDLDMDRIGGFLNYLKQVKKKKVKPGDPMPEPKSKEGKEEKKKRGKKGKKKGKKIKLKK